MYLLIRSKTEPINPSRGWNLRYHFLVSLALRSCCLQPTHFKLAQDSEAGGWLKWKLDDFRSAKTVELKCTVLS